MPEERHHNLTDHHQNSHDVIFNRLDALERQDQEFRKTLYSDSGLVSKMVILWERYQRSKAVELAVLGALILNLILQVIQLKRG